MENKNLWVQAAIDVVDMDLAKQIAKMALDNGAEWIEVGTPLLYKFGYRAIQEIKNIVGNKASIVPDYKTPLSILCADGAKENGADYLLVQAGYNDQYNAYNIDFCKQKGLVPIIDLMNLRADDTQEYINRMSKQGAQYFFTRHFSSYIDKSGKEITIDNLHELKMPVNTKLGITNDDFDDAVFCSQNGADWIVFGLVLRNPNQELCKKWIDALHGNRG